MNNMTKIYFLENSFDYNASNLDSNKIGGNQAVKIELTP